MGGVTTGGVMGLLEQARLAGLDVTSDGEKLVIRGPKQAESIARELIGRKGEVLKVLSGEEIEAEADVKESGPTPRRRLWSPSWPELAATRWGPSSEADENIIVPHDWRSIVAGFPHANWLAWRGLATELQKTFDHDLNDSDIKAIDRDAAIMLGYAE